MSYGDLVKNGWVVAHKSSKQKIANLLGIVARSERQSSKRRVGRLAFRDRLQRGIAGGHDCVAIKQSLGLRPRAGQLTSVFRQKIQLVHEIETELLKV